MKKLFHLSCNFYFHFFFPIFTSLFLWFKTNFILFIFSFIRILWIMVFFIISTATLFSVIISDIFFFPLLHCFQVFHFFFLFCRVLYYLRTSTYSKTWCVAQWIELWNEYKENIHVSSLVSRSHNQSNRPKQERKKFSNTKTKSMKIGKEV